MECYSWAECVFAVGFNISFSTVILPSAASPDSQTFGPSDRCEDMFLLGPPGVQLGFEMATTVKTNQAACWLDVLTAKAHKVCSSVPSGWFESLRLPSHRIFASQKDPFATWTFRNDLCVQSSSQAASVSILLPFPKRGSFYLHTALHFDSWYCILFLKRWMAIPWLALFLWDVTLSQVEYVGITADTSEVPTRSAATHGPWDFSANQVVLLKRFPHFEADLKQRREIRGGMGAKEIVDTHWPSPLKVYIILVSLTKNS